MSPEWSKSTVFQTVNKNLPALAGSGLVVETGFDVFNRHMLAILVASKSATRSMAVPPTDERQHRQPDAA